MVTVSETLDELTDSIALKLLDVEKAVQERIGQMTDMQKGSIVQALLKDEESYKYIVKRCHLASCSINVRPSGDGE